MDAYMEFCKMVCCAPFVVYGDTAGNVVECGVGEFLFSGSFVDVDKLIFSLSLLSAFGLEEYTDSEEFEYSEGESSLFEDDEDDEDDEEDEDENIVAGLFRWSSSDSIKIMLSMLLSDELPFLL